MEVVSTSVSGDLGAPAVDGSGAIVAGDGTGIVDVDRLIVLRAIANPTGFSGDAGGPEASKLRLGFQPKWTKAMPLRMLTPNSESAESSAAVDTANTIDETKLGPSTGADGMIALAMNRDGGTLENPEGAKIVVPQGALSDQTTVMLKPVQDHELPEVTEVTLVPGTAFDVSFSEADGRSVGQLNAPASLTIASIRPRARERVFIVSTVRR